MLSEIALGVPIEAVFAPLVLRYTLTLSFIYQSITIHFIYSYHHESIRFYPSTPSPHSAVPIQTSTQAQMPTPQLAHL